MRITVASFDGFPIYGDNNPDGTLIAQGSFGLCNGQPGEYVGYRYQTSVGAAYVVQCLMGKVADFE